MKSEYLVFNLIILLAPLLSGRLYPKTVWPYWRSLILSITIVAVPFLVWDVLVTERWWSFNSLYTLGWQLGPLPVEEVLFFFTVPFASLFLWLNLHQVFPGTVPARCYRYAGIFASVFLLAGIVGWGGEYTLVSSMVLLGVWLLSGWFVPSLWKQRSTYIFLGLSLILTLIFNGYLTARPVVLYEDAYRLPWRVVSVPPEDFLFGLALLVGNMSLYYRFTPRS